MPFPYVKQTWNDLPAVDTPISASRLAHMEDGIFDATEGPGWVSYVPTTTGLTLGNGSLTGRYTKIGKTVIFAAQFTLGSTSAVTGLISFTLPIAAAQPLWPGVGKLTDSGASYYSAIVHTTTTVGQVFPTSTSGPYANIVFPSATVPFTWTTSDQVALSGFYEIP